MDITPSLSRIASEIYPSTTNTNAVKDKVRKTFNKEAFLKSNNDKMKVIKNILFKSFLNDEVIQSVNTTEINLDSPDDIIKYLKIYDNNILISHKKEICFYVGMGMLIKNIKVIYPCNWQEFLKEHQINYTRDYLTFLVRLYNLFEKYKLLYKSSLSLSFFRKNFSLVKTILKDQT